MNNGDNSTKNKPIKKNGELLIDPTFSFINLSENDKNNIKTPDEYFYNNINYTKNVFKNSFRRYDKMFDKLVERNKRCIEESNCNGIYDWIEANSTRVITDKTDITNNNKNIDPSDENYKPFHEIKFNSIEAGKVGIQKLRELSQCKKECNSNLILFQNKFKETMLYIEKRLNGCFDTCKLSFGDEPTTDSLVSCYSRCFVHYYSIMAVEEFKLDYLLDVLLKDYDSPKKPKVNSIYLNVHKRKLDDDDVIRRYI